MTLSDRTGWQGGGRRHSRNYSGNISHQPYSPICIHSFIHSFIHPSINSFLRAMPTQNEPNSHRYIRSSSIDSGNLSQNLDMLHGTGTFHAKSSNSSKNLRYSCPGIINTDKKLSKHDYEYPSPQILTVDGSIDLPKPSPRSPVTLNSICLNINKSKRDRDRFDPKLADLHAALAITRLKTPTIEANEKDITWLEAAMKASVDMASLTIWFLCFFPVIALC